MASDHERAMAEALRQCEIEKNRAIEETKKKQWCTFCGKEALLYCCWNTSYCDYPCQVCSLTYINNSDELQLLCTVCKSLCERIPFISVSSLINSFIQLSIVLRMND